MKWDFDTIIDVIAKITMILILTAGGVMAWLLAIKLYLMLIR